MTDVLHVPYTYFPDPCGGTEVYVRGLAHGLVGRGIDCAVAAPAQAASRYEDAGLVVHRFGADQRARLDLAYGVPDEIAADSFREVVAQSRPRIVHLHARTSAVSERLIDAAHAAGARVVFTYHTPTVSCARGTMMHQGTTPCDGLIETRRCTACTLSARGVPAPLARLTAAAPVGVLRGMSAVSNRTAAQSRLRIPGLIAGAGERFRSFIDKADHVVAVCAWVRDVLVRNHVPATKITLSRQGISPHGCVVRRERTLGLSPLRIAYFGRVDHTKGPDLLARALPLIPQTNVAIDIYGVRQSGSDPAVEWLERRARAIQRIRPVTAVRGLAQSAA